METKILNQADFTEIVTILNQGGIVALPTDTVYGLAVRFDLDLAVSKLKSLKGRDADKPFTFLVSNLSQIEKIAHLKERDYQLVEKCLPGPITFLFLKQASLDDKYTNGLNTVAIRMLADETINQIIEAVNQPLLLTSANLSGEKAAFTSEEVYSVFNEKIEAILVGESQMKMASTIVDSSSETLLLKRTGPISLPEIKRKAGLDMKISIGADHGAFKEKELLVKHLKELGYEVVDYGTDSEASVDYPDFAGPVAQSISDHESDFGIVMCGTGIGASITANKYPGVRAALVYDPEIAKITREHNDSNVLALGGRVTPIEDMYKIVDSWLATPFTHDARHERRINKLTKIEEEHHEG